MQSPPTGSSMDMVQGLWLVKTLLPAYYFEYKISEHVKQISAHAYTLFGSSKDVNVCLCLKENLLYVSRKSILRKTKNGERERKKQSIQKMTLCRNKKATISEKEIHGHMTDVSCTRS